ncbi:hypothetical protein [Streptomyces sp. 11x1]|uniref:hypothetical protein n=1 Tax=Streptomyces sp. 11x1 TaxID=3038642 RepID=UPI00292D48CD|nr:hypothetical protein [Streptomyces sp. 11x1]WNZ11891.1 hypothetical protein P8T65_32940 [Streptomyces sp. 11x1]
MTPLSKRAPEWRPDLDDVRAVSCIRQSKQREDDGKASPEAQRTKCEALITAKGWDIAGHFADGLSRLTRQGALEAVLIIRELNCTASDWSASRNPTWTRSPPSGSES